MKKRAVLIGATLLISSVTSILLVADESINLELLHNYVLGSSNDISENLDYSKDGVVNAFDIVIAKQTLNEKPVTNTILVSNTDELQQALKNAVAGDTILVASGIYEAVNSGNPKGSLFYSSSEGTENAPITIKAQDIENPPILKGTDLEHGYVLYITGDYWNIENLKISNAQKGIVLDNSNYSIISNCEAYTFGAEAIHLRDGSSYCTVKDCIIYDTGLVTQGYGEGVYIGSAKSTSGYTYECDYNVIDGCRFSNIAAEPIDIKEYTTGTIVRNCYFDGTGISGANYAGSFVDIQGNDCKVYDNIGYRNGNENIIAAVEMHVQVDNWGFNAEVYNNIFYMDVPVGSTGRNMFVVDGWYNSVTVYNNMVSYGEELFLADKNCYKCGSLTIAD